MKVTNTRKKNNISENDDQREIDISATDGGDETQENYRFQNLCTSLIALDMFRGVTEYEELFCEIYEDVVAVKKNNHFVGIQIKYRDKRYGPFPITDSIIHKTLNHFNELDSKFPKKFDKFIIISNSSILSVRKNSIDFLLEYCKKNQITKIKEDELKELITKLSQNLKITDEKLINLLKRVEVITVPDRDLMVDFVATKHTQPLEMCKTKNIYELRKIVHSLTDLIANKSRIVDDALTQFFEFCEKTEIKKNHQKINFKRVTKKHVKEIIEKAETIIFLGPEKISPTKIGSYDLINVKMGLGGINESEIQNIRNLTHSAESYFLEKHYENDINQNSKRELTHLETLLSNQAATAETSARLRGKDFGARKLDSINKKIEEIHDKRSKDVFDISPEILKGVVGLLITQCKVAFSDIPKGGFA